MSGVGGGKGRSSGVSYVPRLSVKQVRTSMRNLQLQEQRQKPLSKIRVPIQSASHKRMDNKEGEVRLKSMLNIHKGALREWATEEAAMHVPVMGDVTLHVDEAPPRPKALGKAAHKRTH